MRYWFDTEFNEHGNHIELISIGILAEDGRQYYMENAELDRSLIGDWVQQNVLNQLEGPSKPLKQIREDIVNFFSPAPTEIWAWFGEYDWIVLRQLIGHMLDWPQGWPLSHMNLEQFRLDLNCSELPPQPQNAHHALADAQWCYKAWQVLEEIKGNRSR